MDLMKADLVVVGAGPGGYAAAFYAADLGLRVILVEKGARLGGTCLNTGCIPSKAYLNATRLIHEARASAARGITFAAPQIDLPRLRAWKDGVLTRMGAGLAMLAQKRSVTVLHGSARFTGSNTLSVATAAGDQAVEFVHAILATGSKSALPPAFAIGHPAVMTSREALDLADIPPKLLVVGGGYIGMELGTVYAALGSKVVVVEALDSILSGADPDLVRPVMLAARRLFQEVRLKARVVSMVAEGAGLRVVTEVNGVRTEEMYDRALISVGRVADTAELGLDATKVQLDARGFVAVDGGQRTSDPGILAIGDVVGGVMLAHKAAREARVAVETVVGRSLTPQKAVIPAVVFTDPEVAWCGLTETEAREKGLVIEVAKFPWGASGRAQTYDRVDGLTKLVVEPGTGRLLGVGLVGHGAGELIAEAVLALEAGLTARQLAWTVHPHPTLSETLMEAAEVFYGHPTHTLPRVPHGGGSTLPPRG